LKWLLPVIPIAVFCATAVLVVAMSTEESRSQRPKTESLRAEAFRWAVNRAINAADLTQTAASNDEWSTVSLWWKEAIDLMKSVPKSHPKYPLAQEKIQEYQRKLAYAQSQSNKYTHVLQADATAATNLWSVGSRRMDVLRIQGQPTHEARYDALCQEVMYYGKSMVEFSNGRVVKYEDVDKKFKVAPEDTVITSSESSHFAWTIGNSGEEVFRIQGTPDRVTRYDSLRKETLYYNNSMVELTEGIVTGYSNLDGSLRVAITPVHLPGGDYSSSFWTIGSDRNDVFRVQGTPTQVVLDNSLCREILHYDNSTIELKNGFVAGYDNAGRNLRVEVK
jgi:hypothetical protein